MVDKQKYIVKKSRSNIQEDKKNEPNLEKKINFSEKIVPIKENFQDINNYYEEVQINYLDNFSTDYREIFCDDHLKENKKKSIQTY